MSQSPSVGIEDGRPGVFWVYDALIDSRLRYYAKAVYVVLARQARTGKRLHYSHAEIAQMADVSVTSVRRGLADLKKAGWLKIIETVIPDSPLKGPNIYKLIVPTALAEQSSVQGEQVDRSGGTVDCSARTITTEERPLQEELQHPEVKTPLLFPIDAAFETFWQKYPKKVAKEKARQAWMKRGMAPGSFEIARIMEAVVEQQAPGNTLNPTNGKGFIPHAASWLNGARWNDEVVEAPKPKAAGRPTFDVSDWEGRASA